MLSLDAVSADYLTLREAGLRARLSPRTLKRAIQAGELRAYRVGRLIRIAEADLKVFMERRPVRKAKK